MALARWNELGVSTPVNPVLQMAFDLYFAPMGVACDALVYDALSAIGNRDAVQLRLVSPRWIPSKVDTTWSQYPVFEPLIELSDYISPVFGEDGAISEVTVINQPDENDALLIKKFQLFENEQADRVFEVSDTIVSAAKIYIDACVELLVTNDPSALEFVEDFLKNPRQFALLAFDAFTRKIDNKR